MSSVPDSPPTLADLIQLLSKLIKLIGASLRTPAAAPPPRRPLVCSYCSSARHLIRHCPRVLTDIRTGICKRNARGRVVLPSGLYVPHNIAGPNLRARLLAHTRQQQLVTPPVVHRLVPVVAPPPVPPSMTPPSLPSPLTSRAPIVLPNHIPGYAPPSRYVVAGLPDAPSPRRSLSNPTSDTRTVPVAPAESPTVVARDVHVATVVQLPPTSTPAPVPLLDPVADAFRELRRLGVQQQLEACTGT
ncbi:hypothetical protein GGX14DRAFT_392084 [Mycena pura]|uniref:Uncharacterized protein n=1 Tax=Mycena pura TaxID=153505 RepID=A0AAD6VMS6_9AGAR|nr:hypothetical protein GGX14DRAFT_392084 [Mycena pura]